MLRCFELGGGSLRKVKRKELIERWRGSDDFLSEINKRKGDQKDLADLRGLPVGDGRFRQELRDLNVSWADFSFASFLECGFTKVKFENCKFERTTFKELRSWDSEFVDCEFDGADFTNSTLGVRSRFTSCVFRNCKLKGKYFNFGTQARFRDCSFVDCHIQSAWILSVTFERCNFASKLVNMRFSGALEASVSHDDHEYPATLIDCDLSKSVFKSVEIMDGAIFENTLLPDQTSRRGFERTYYEGP